MSPLLTVLPPAAPPPSLPPVLQGMPKEEAVRWLLQIYAANEHGHAIPTDNELIEAWLPICSRTGSQETISAYRRELQHLQDWLAHEAGGLTLREVDPVVADRWVRSLRAKVDAGRMAARSFNRRLAAVSSFYGWCSDPARSGWSAVPRNPLPRKSYLQVGKTRKALTEPDLDLILGAVRTAAQAGSMIAQRDYVLIRALFLIGLRVSEMAGLRWGDVERLPDGTGKVTVTGKGSKVRAVKISTDTLLLLESLPGGRKGDDQWLWPSNRRPGQHLTRQALNSRVSKWGKAVGVHCYAHRMRHTHITIANRRGCDVFTLMQTVGHSGAQTTSGYISLDPSDSSSLRLG